MLIVWGNIEKGFFFFQSGSKFNNLTEKIKKIKTSTIHIEPSKKMKKNVQHSCCQNKEELYNVFCIPILFDNRHPNFLDRRWQTNGVLVTHIGLRDGSMERGDQLSYPRGSHEQKELNNGNRSPNKTAQQNIRKKRNPGRKINWNLAKKLKISWTLIFS